MHRDRHRQVWCFIFLTGLACRAAPHARAAQQDSARVQAIRATARSYLQAMEQGDAEAVKRFWTPDGIVVDPAGRRVSAHELIDSEFRPDTPDQRPHVTIEERDIRLLADHVAIEDGVSTVQRSGEAPPVRGRFTVIWVQREDGWKLAELRESAVAVSGPGPLQELEWLVGDWVSLGHTPPIFITASWSDQAKYIVRRIRIGEEAVEGLHATQRIGWDESEKVYRSWTFVSDGEFSQQRWRREGEAWVVTTEGVRPDGSKMSSVSFWLPEGPGRCAFRSADLSLGGQKLPASTIEFLRVGN
jgi:uncharacterized protein (TIGR02246 family)